MSVPVRPQTTRIFHLTFNDTPAAGAKMTPVSIQEVHDLNPLFQDGWKVKSVNYEQKSAFLILERA